MDQLNWLSSLILGGSGIIVTIIFSFHARSLQNDLFRKQLFESFNERYDKLNDHIQFILDSGITNLETLEKTAVTVNGNTKNCKQILIDYFNLCAEEYYWAKRRKRIDKVMWKGWHAGMIYWYEKLPVLKTLWEKEKGENGHISYYLKENEDFFIN